MVEVVVVVVVFVVVVLIVVVLVVVVLGVVVILLIVVLFLQVFFNFLLSLEPVFRPVRDSPSQAGQKVWPSGLTIF